MTGSSELMAGVAELMAGVPQLMAGVAEFMVLAPAEAVRMVGGEPLEKPTILSNSRAISAKDILSKSTCSAFTAISGVTPLKYDSGSGW